MSVQLQANRQTPAQWALIGLGILAAGLFLAVPLAFIFIQAFRNSDRRREERIAAAAAAQTSAMPV